MNSYRRVHLSRRRAFSSLLVAIFLLAASFIPDSPIITKSHAVEPLQPLLDCASTPQSSCIEAIYLVDEDGKRKRASLTGRSSSETRTYAPDSVLRATWQEYEFEGEKFGGKAGGAFIPRVFYFPKGNRDCFYDPCVEGGEYFEFALSPTWLNGPSSDKPLPLPFRNNNLACGLKSNPSPCYPVDLFNTSSSFEFHVRIPAPFKTITSTGRGVQDFSIEERELLSVSGSTFRRTVVRAQPVIYASYGLAGADIEEYAHYETDRFVFWLWGESDRRMRTLGSCFQTPKLSVVSNIFHAAFPQWDKRDESIYVNVAGPHYKSDGSINLGLIQVKISPALARCLWNVDVTKKVEAKVSVTYETPGQERSQTSSSRLTGDEFVLTISGLTFSSPTIGIKLMDSKTAPEPKPTLDSSSESVQDQESRPNVEAPKSEIKCKKGKKTRRLPDKMGKCPKGWKKI